MKKFAFLVLLIVFGSCQKLSMDVFQIRNNTSQAIKVSLINTGYTQDKEFDIAAYTIVTIFQHEYSGQMYDYRPDITNRFTDSTLLFEYNNRMVVIPQVMDSDEWEYVQNPVKKWSKYGENVYTFTVGYEMLQ